MKYLKQVISIFLLFVYSIGFTHSVIPHTHLNEFIFDGNNFHSENHKHASIENIDFDDVNHKDHLDDNLLDYVLCLFSEMKHDKTYQVDEYLITFDKESSSVNDLVLIKLNTLLFTFSTVPQPLQKGVFSQKKSITNYLIPLLDSFSFRGPPSFSC